MKTENSYGVIMAGGIGSRFWPMSTENYPKQFHDVLQVGRTLIQQTYDRLLKLIPAQNIFVLTSIEYKQLTESQLPEVPVQNILLEPQGKNTAPCNLYAASKILKQNPEANLVVAPSDHLILDESAFIDTLEYAMDCSESKDSLITLGIKPTFPNTGYGYIQFDKAKTLLKPVLQFTEKPVLALAEKFISSGDYLWNSGIFVWKAQTILDAFDSQLNSMHALFEPVKVALDSDKEQKELEVFFSKVESLSIDFGIMEKAKNVDVVPASFGWSDLGTWNALYKQSEKKITQDVVYGDQVYTYNTEGNMIKMPKGKVLIVEGLKDYIIVDTKEALLLCPREKDQEVKKFVKNIKK